MTGKERVCASLEGRPVDRYPVSALYYYLTVRDHFAELTGRARWQMHKWAYASPEDYLATFRRIYERTSMEILQPDQAPSRRARANAAFVEKDGEAYLHDRESDTLTPLSAAAGHASTYAANETQYVFDREDVNRQVKIRTAREITASGVYDYVKAVVECFGRDHFVLSGGVIGTLYACHDYVGLTNLFAMLVEKPDHRRRQVRRLLAEQG